MGSYPSPIPGQPGKRQATFRPGTAKVILPGLLLVLLGLPCAITGMRYNLSPTVYDNESNSLPDLLMTVGIVLILVGIVSFILAFNNRKLRVDLYEHGFVLTSKRGTQEIRWDQITHVWHKLEEITSTTVKDPQTGENTTRERKTSADMYVVQCADGSTWEIDTTMYGLSKFGPVLEQIYPRYLLPGVLASYQEGNPVTFGTLTVSSSGIKNRRDDEEQEAAWGSFDALVVDKSKGGIALRRAGELQAWSTISITSTPDVGVFEALVQTLLQQMAPDPQG